MSEKHKISSTGALEKRSVGDLVKLHRELTGVQPKFTQKAALVRACLLALSENQTPKDIPKRKVEKDAVRKKPFGADPTKLEPKHPGSGTKVFALISMLRIGATFPQILERFGWTYRQATAQLKRVNTVHGYGIYEYPNRKIIVFTYEEGPPDETI